jgi:hypothetical protein
MSCFMSILRDKLGRYIGFVHAAVWLIVKDVLYYLCPITNDSKLLILFRLIAVSRGTVAVMPGTIYILWVK